MPFRVAAEVLSHLLPVAAGMSPETLRGHTLKIGERLRAASAVNQVAVVPRSITVTTDSTFIRSHDDRERHLEVRVGNVETGEGGRQVFGAVARSETDIAALIRRCLDAVGRTAGATVPAFTDGCAGLQSILTYARRHAPADCRLVPYRHAAAACEAGGERMSTDEPGRLAAKTAIVAEVERLHWRIWNGKAKNAQLTLDRIRKVMHVFRGERGHRIRGVASRKLCHALYEIDSYLNGQSARLVNHAERYRAGQRVGTSVTEGTANFLVNRRMNKSQQMRWSRRGADLLQQVRCAVYNGALTSGFGQRFEPLGRSGAELALAAVNHLTGPRRIRKRHPTTPQPYALSLIPFSSRGVTWLQGCRLGAIFAHGVVSFAF